MRLKTKILILTLPLSIICCSVNAQDVYCGTKSYEEIDQCSVEDKLPYLIGRLYPSHTYKNLSFYNAVDPCDPETVDNSETEEVEECPVWSPKKDAFTYTEQTYDDEDNPELSFYDRLQMENKPDLSMFEADLVSWKQLQKDDLDFRTSIKTMDRFERRRVKCGYNNHNIALMKEDMLKQKDTIRRDCLASKTAELDLEDAAQDASDKFDDDMRFAKKLEKGFIIYINTTSGNDDARTERLLTKLHPVRQFLGIGKIDSAKAKLLLISVDADLSQGAKDLFISKIDAYLDQ